MRHRLRGFMMVLCVMVGGLGAVPGAVAPAGADSVSLTKDVSVSAPPSGSFAGAQSGDGWDVLFSGDRIFNVFHHGDHYVVDCHLQTDGSHCDTVDDVSPWPKTVTSDDPASEFTSPAHSSGWVDTTTGYLYGWASRIADGTGGIVCVDLESVAANPFCGFTALTAAGENPEGYTTAFGGRALIGTEMLTYDPTIGQVLCFSTATAAPCAGQPYDVALGGITPDTLGYSDNSTLASGGKLFIHAEDSASTGGVFTCFDATTRATCTGSWPQLITDSVPDPVNTSWIGAAFPYLTSDGAAAGACLPYDTIVPCWDASGAPIATPTELVNAIGHTDTWNEGTTFGTRVFVPTGEAAGGTDAVFCYDFATGAACPNFPIETGSFTYLYSVTRDPLRTGCMWINADSSYGSTSQIRTFDGYDGSLGCSDRVHVASGIVIPDADCNALGWSNVQVLDPLPSDYTSASLSLTADDGTPVADGTDLAPDSEGVFDLSTLTIPDSVLFTATFVGPTFSTTGVIFRFTWDSVTSNDCEANATRVPDAPTIDTVTPNGADGGLTVAYTPPADPGTSPITNYSYSTDHGLTWRLRTDGGAAASPMEITQASSDGTVLADGVSYDVIVRAINDVGTGLASNSVTAIATVPELLSAPSAASVPVGSATSVTPVYLAGFTNGVTVALSTSNGSLAVVGNGGLTESPCTTCSGPDIYFAGSQNAVNVALATLSATPASIGSGLVTVAVTKDGDEEPSQTASIVLTVTLPRLATPAAPSTTATSTSSIAVTFSPTANATSYTVRVYRSNGITLVGTPHTGFTSGSAISALDASTQYKFSVTAVGDGALHDDSLEGAKAARTTMTAVSVPPTHQCGTPKPSQGLPNGSGAVYATDSAGHLTTAPSFDAVHASLTRPIIGAVATTTGDGSWSLASDGGVFTAGDAGFRGSLGGRALNAPVTSIVGTPCDAGYDILASDGGIFSFGDARFYGSMGATKLNLPMTGIALTCNGHGYYTVAGDGGVFTFGDAKFHGSMADLALVSPIFGIASNCDNTGYWFVARDGGVFTAGNVGYYGSLGGTRLTSPVVSLIPTRTYHGYWLVSADGTTHAFGDAAR